MFDIFRAAGLEWVRQSAVVGWVLVGACVLLAIETFTRGRMSQRWRTAVGALAVVCASVVGLTLAWQVLWLGDDAFISFRYAQNFAQGRGLVFNPGEWVEGYTNFLWTFVLGIAAWFGGDLPYVALFGNLACFVGALVATAALVRRSSPGPVLLPFASFALAGSYAFTTWASSGLETMPVACLVIAGAWASTTRRGALWSGLLLTAAAMARPDQVLVYGCMGIALVAEDLSCNQERPFWRRLVLRRYLAYAAPFVFFFIPWFFWRWNAYGDFYPNTYYAKSGGEAYYSQGLIYAAQFIATSGGIVWLVALAVGLWGGVRNRHELRLRVFAGLSFLLFTHYVIKVGGDFMQHRFFIPMMPVVFAAIEVGSRWRIAEARNPWKRGLAAALAGAALVAALVPIRLIPDFRLRWMIAAEHTYYRITSLYPLEIASALWREGHQLQKVFTSRDLKPRFAIECVGMVSYLSDLPLVDILGLTNRRIAHKPIQRRSRPGHEKWANLQEILEEDAVVAWNTHDSGEFAKESRAVVDGVEFHFLRYDPDLIQAFSRTDGSILPDPQKDIERIAGAADREQVAAALTFYTRFLERHPERESLLRRLDDRLNIVESFEGELPPTATIDGTGLVIRKVSPRSGQWLPAGVSGKGWLASLPDEGDGKGRVTLPLGKLEREELRFALGGSRSKDLAVELWVDGEAVRQAHPEGERGLQPVIWNLQDLSGREATLIVRDDDPRKGIGLLIDGIHWSAARDDLRERLAKISGGTIDGDIQAWAAAAATLREARNVLPDPPITGSHTHWPLDHVWPEGTDIEGDAFGDGPVSRLLHSQGAVYRYLGKGFVSSYHGEDSATGKLSFPEMVLPEGGVHLLVAGGKNCQKTWVGLQVGKRTIARACGSDDEVFRPVSLNPGAFAGQMGRVVVVDQSTEGWGHILVDEVVVAPAPGPRAAALETLPAAGSRPRP